MRYAGLIAALLVLAGPVGAESLLDRAKRDAIATVLDGDPDMDAAMRKARETLPKFLALVRSPRPTITSFSVKIGIPYPEGKEYFWMSPFELRKDDIIGRINNTPRLVKSVKLGQAIIFKEKDIVDWLYREGGRMFGNFTACALLKREPREQAEAFMKQFGLSCDP
jgi:uncharacterized protein YegJ (DUF2314 family)